MLTCSQNFESNFFKDFNNSLSSNVSMNNLNILNSFDKIDSSKFSFLDSDSNDSNLATLINKRLPGGGNTFNIKRRKTRKVTFNEAVHQNRLYQTSSLNIKQNLDRQEAGGKGSDVEKANKDKNDNKEVEVDICCEFFPTLFCKNKEIKPEPLVTAFGSGTLTNCGKNLLYENTEFPTFQTPKQFEHLLIVEDNSDKNTKTSKTSKASKKDKKTDQKSLAVSNTTDNNKTDRRANAGSDIYKKDITKKSIYMKHPNKDTLPYNKIRLNAGGDNAKLKYDSEGKLIPSKTSKLLAEKVLRARAELINDTKALNQRLEEMKKKLVQYILSQKMMRELRRPLNRFDIGFPELSRIYWDAKFNKVSNPCRKCCCPK